MQIVDFIREYWQYIGIALVTIIEIVILFLKKTKIDYQLPSSWYPDLISLIQEAESIYGDGHGKQKLNYVIEKMRSKLNIKYYDGVLEMLIEQIVDSVLSSPTKKGGQGREKTSKEESEEDFQ